MSDLGNKEIFARNLKHYMDLSNKDRNAVCEVLDIPYTTLSDWLNAKKYPRIDKIEMLANYFNIEKSDLIERKERTEISDKRTILFNKIKDLPPEKQQIILNVTESVIKEIDKEIDGQWKNIITN